MGLIERKSKMNFDHNIEETPDTASVVETAETSDATADVSNDSPHTLSRRAMLGALGGGAIAGAAALTMPMTPAVAKSGPTDAEILNFALNLEYTEAEFYTYAVTGQGIEAMGLATDGKGTYGPTTGGRKAEISDPILRAVAEELAFVERQHVKLLRSVLGRAAIAKPAINLNGLGIGFANEAEYLTVSRYMEDTGISAYAGASTLIQSKVILGTAARILGDEAYHMGNIRLMIAQKGITVRPIDALDILPPPAGRKFFAVDNFGLALVRNMPQVSAIFRPFLPNGMNRGG